MTLIETIVAEADDAVTHLRAIGPLTLECDDTHLLASVLVELADANRRLESLADRLRGTHSVAQDATEAPQPAIGPIRGRRAF